MTSIPQNLLDDLRLATEFYDCVVIESKAGHDCVSTGAWRDAEEWLRSAALNLGTHLARKGEVSNA
ncbi:hypothetical protein ACIGKL_05100 [Pseudomonas sp. NPDC077186]|uniref:hypothetical protein n=1 Tax=Pseudomonas sp. NPDC077186 TaxID=3364421 RepID=UPI0037C76C9B